MPEQNSCRSYVWSTGNNFMFPWNMSARKIIFKTIRSPEALTRMLPTLQFPDESPTIKDTQIHKDRMCCHVSCWGIMSYLEKKFELHCCSPGRGRSTGTHPRRWIVVASDCWWFVRTHVSGVEPLSYQVHGDRKQNLSYFLLRCKLFSTVISDLQVIFAPNSHQQINGMASMPRTLYSLREILC